MEKVKKFKSKKNKVFLIKEKGEFKILKEFGDIKSFNKEKNYYDILSIENLNLPIVEEKNILEKTMKIQYLGDKTALHLIEEYEEELDDEGCLKILKRISIWLYRFHSINIIKERKLSFFDINLRNFILYRDKIYAIDLESISEGTLIKDISKLIAMYLNYDPVNSDFKIQVSDKLKEYIIDNFRIKREDLDHLIEMEVETIKKRRTEK